MDPGNRDWGRPNPVDYVPVAGVFYRCYWCLIARRGFRSERTETWRNAIRSEYGRLFVSLSFTAALFVFVALGGTDVGASALIPALTFAFAGVFVHRLLSIAGVF